MGCVRVRRPPCNRDAGKRREKSIQRNNETLFFIIFITAIFAGIAGFYWNKFIAQLFSSLFFIFTCGIVFF
jgi:hypothetical protein